MKVTILPTCDRSVYYWVEKHKMVVMIRDKKNLVRYIPLTKFFENFNKYTTKNGEIIGQV